MAAGNLGIAGVNKAMVKPVHITGIEAGAQTWVDSDEAASFEVNQKIDFTGDNGLSITQSDGKTQPLQGTFLVAEIRGSRLRLINAIDQQSISTTGAFALAEGAKVSTSYLVGPAYFYFFAGVVFVMAFVFIVFALRYKEQSFMRTDDAPTTA